MALEERDLEELGRKAARDWTEGRFQSLNEAAASYIKSAGEYLSRDQMERVTNYTNKEAYLLQHNSIQGNHRYVQFDTGPARVDEVIKQATGLPEPVYYRSIDDYTTPPEDFRKKASWEELFGVEAFPPDEPPARLDPFFEAKQIFTQVDSVVKQAASERDVAELALETAKAAFREQMKLAHQEGASLRDLVRVLGSINPDPKMVKAAFQIAYEDLVKVGKHTPETYASSLKKTASVGEVNPEHPLAKSYAVLSKAAEKVAVLKDLEEDALEKRAFVKEQYKKASTSSPAASVPLDFDPTSIWDTVKKFGLNPEVKKELIALSRRGAGVGAGVGAGLGTVTGAGISALTSKDLPEEERKKKILKGALVGLGTGGLLGTGIGAVGSPAHKLHKDLKAIGKELSQDPEFVAMINSIKSYGVPEEVINNFIKDVKNANLGYSLTKDDGLKDEIAQYIGYKHFAPYLGTEKQASQNPVPLDFDPTSIWDTVKKFGLNPEVKKELIALSRRGAGIGGGIGAGLGAATGAGISALISKDLPEEERKKNILMGSLVGLGSGGALGAGVGAVGVPIAKREKNLLKYLSALSENKDYEELVRRGVPKEVVDDYIYDRAKYQANFKTINKPFDDEMHEKILKNLAEKHKLWDHFSKANSETKQASGVPASPKGLWDTIRGAGASVKNFAESAYRRVQGNDVKRYLQSPAIGVLGGGLVGGVYGGVRDLDEDQSRLHAIKKGLIRGAGIGGLLGLAHSGHTVYKENPETVKSLLDSVRNAGATAKNFAESAYQHGLTDNAKQLIYAPAVGVLGGGLAGGIYGAVNDLDEDQSRLHSIKKGLIRGAGVGGILGLAHSGHKVYSDHKTFHNQLGKSNRSTNRDFLATHLSGEGPIAFRQKMDLSDRNALERAKVANEKEKGGKAGKWSYRLVDSGLGLFRSAGDAVGGAGAAFGASIGGKGSLSEALGKHLGTPIRYLPHIGAGLLAYRGYQHAQAARQNPYVRKVMSYIPGTDEHEHKKMELAQTYGSVPVHG